MADRVGQQLGNYRLVRLLGRGGFAEVYLGEHVRLKTHAAIKVLHTQLADDEAGDFLKEAQTIANLEHPHIVRVLDFDIQEGTPFLVVSYAPNGTLRQRHPKGTQLPFPTIVSYVKQVAEALQYAHDVRVIHRDIKPENLLLGRRNEVLLSDFGIATVAKSSRYQNRQDIAGTIAYMAPEQIQAYPRPASDQYSLGIVVYEWIAGTRPFSGTSTEVAAKHIYVAPPPLHEKLPSISPTLEEVVRTALVKDPKQRFGSVQAFATALEQASQETKIFPVSKPSISPPSIPVPPPSWQEQKQQSKSGRSDVSEAQEPELSTSRSESRNAAQSFEPLVLISEAAQMLPLTAPEALPVVIRQKKRLSKRKVVLPVIFVLLLGVMIPLLYGTVNTYQANLQVTATKGSELNATATTRAELNATATAALNAYNTAITANGIMSGFNPQHTHLNPYEKVLSPTNVSRLVRDWAFQTGDDVDSSPAVANGMVYVGSHHNLYALDARTGSKLWALQIGHVVDSSPAVANGMVYIGSDDHNLYALDARTGGKLWTLQTGGAISSSPAVANGMVYVGSGDDNLYALNARTGGKLWAFQTGGVIGSSPAVANGVVYVGSRDHNLYALDARTGGKLWAFQTGNYIYSSPAVANGMVYIGSDDHNLYALDARTGGKLWAFQTGDFISSSPAVANGVVYIGSYDRNLYALDARTGGKLWTFQAGQFIFSSPAVANGVVYIGSNFNLYALDARTGGKLWAFRAGNHILSSPAVANGVIYVGSDDYNLYAFYLLG